MSLTNRTASNLHILRVVGFRVFVRAQVFRTTVFHALCGILIDCIYLGRQRIPELRKYLWSFRYQCPVILGDESKCKASYWSKFFHQSPLGHEFGNSTSKDRSYPLKIDFLRFQGTWSFPCSLLTLDFQTHDPIMTVKKNSGATWVMSTVNIVVSPSFATGNCKRTFYISNNATTRLIHHGYGSSLHKNNFKSTIILMWEVDNQNPLPMRRFHLSSCHRCRVSLCCCRFRCQYICLLCCQCHAFSSFVNTTPSPLSLSLPLRKSSLSLPSVVAIRRRHPSSPSVVAVRCRRSRRRLSLPFVVVVCRRRSSFCHRLRRCCLSSPLPSSSFLPASVISPHHPSRFSLLSCFSQPLLLLPLPLSSLPQSFLSLVLLSLLLPPPSLL